MMNYAPYVQRNLEAGMRVMIYLGTGDGVLPRELQLHMPLPSSAPYRLGTRADQGCACGAEQRTGSATTWATGSG